MTMDRNAPPKVLVVEDDQNLAELYAEWLTDSYRVETAYSGDAALDAFDESVDVVLLDRMMPGLSGGEVLTRLKQHDHTCQVVMISAVTPDFDIVKMGFDAYLEKPVEGSDLEDVVSRMLTRAEYNDDLQTLFSLIERQSTLEAVMDATTLEEHPKYRSLAEQIRELEDKVERYLRNLPDADFRVAMERLQRTAAERRERQQYESLTEDVLDTSHEGIVVIDSQGRVVWANETTEALLGVDRTGIQGRDYAQVATESYRAYRSEDRSLADLVTDVLESVDAEVEATVHVPATDGTDQRWLQYWSGPIRTGLYAGGRIEHYHDITERYAYERQLENLHAVSRDLMTSGSVREIGETVVDAAVDELGFELAAIYTRDESTGRLAPLTRSGTGRTDEIDLPTISEGDGAVWTAYVDRTEQLASEDVPDARASSWLSTEFGSWRVYSLGSGGVLLLGAVTASTVASRTDQLAKTLAANTASAFTRAAQETSLRDRDERLNEQNERLTRLNRINTLIRSISATVIDADTREALEQDVCDALAQLDLVSGAWIGKRDVQTDTIEVRAKSQWLTYENVWNEDRPVADDEQRNPSDVPPAERAHMLGDAVVEDDLMTARSGTHWARNALDNGVHSVVAVPIRGESAIVGVLEVQSKLPNAFADDEVAALAELGEIIGHRISSVRQRAALMSGGGTTLEMQLEADIGFAALVSDSDAEIEVLNVLTESPRPMLFARVTGSDVTSETFEAAGFDPETVVLSESLDGIHCKIPVRNSNSFERITAQGVAIDAVTNGAASNTIVVTVTVPFTVDVREYLQSLRQEYPDLTLLSKIDSERGDTGSSVSARLDDALTTRQREVVQTALYAGYFDWPRDADSVTVAESLDIAQSTFNQHLRAAELNILGALYGKPQ
jgi:PAS domain S-box-containing protein